MVLYEYPFNESIRTMLRLEHLFDRLGQLLPRTEAVAEAAYQDYHQGDVIDFAALMEIHRLNLDTLNPDDEAESDESNRLSSHDPLDDDIEPLLDGEERKST